MWWWCFSEFFPKAATQRGVVLEITPVEGRFGEFGELAHRVLLKCRCPVCRRMPDKDFLKKVLKSENVFKIFGNIPDVADFLQKGWTISDFLHMYYDDNRRNVWKRVSTKKVTIFSKAVGKNRDIRERNWIESKKSRFSSKAVRQKRDARERNWVEWIFFGFLQKWWN